MYDTKRHHLTAKHLEWSLLIGKKQIYKLNAQRRITCAVWILKQV